MTKPKEGMNVYVYTPNKEKYLGVGVIEKVEPLVVEETGEILTHSYPSRIVLENGDVTEGLKCWWIEI